MNATQTKNAVWSMVGADGKTREIFVAEVQGDRPVFSVEIDGKQVSKGQFQRINRENPAHRNAPKGVTHIIGTFCLTAETAAKAAPVLEAIRQEEAAKYEARIASGRAEYLAKNAAKRARTLDRCETFGVDRKRAEAVLNRYGWEPGDQNNAWEAGDTQAYGIMVQAGLSGDNSNDNTPITKQD